MSGNPIDEVITRITDAPTDGVAHEIMRSVPHLLLLKVADQLYVETEGHGDQAIRIRIVKEARA